MPFSYLLGRLRVEHGLSQRKLGQLAGIHHTYLEKLEKGIKKRPQPEKVEQLVRGLGLTGREAWLLVFVATYPGYLNVEMIEHFLAHPDLTQDEFSWAVGAKFRLPEGVSLEDLFGCARELVKTVEGYPFTSVSLISTPR